MNTSTRRSPRPLLSPHAVTRRGSARRRVASGSIWIAAAASVVLVGTPAEAAVVPTVQLATAANYAVLANATVTNAGPSVLNNSVGLWPGTSITGFPPGIVIPPATIDATNAAAQTAQNDLTAAYVDAANRPIDATTTADLSNLNLGAGVYSGPNKSPLEINGPLVLDGAGDLTSVFIFQTNSTLTSGSASTVTLINGAQECNVFWQVGSSATLGGGSVFVGNILALTSVTVGSGAVVHGRALARNGAVTLANDTFTSPTCAQPTPATTTPATTAPVTTTPATTAVGATPSTSPGGGSGVVPVGGGGGGSTSPAIVIGPSTPGLPGQPGQPGDDVFAQPGDDLLGVTLPVTGRSIWGSLAIAATLLMAGGATVALTRRRPDDRRA